MPNRHYNWPDVKPPNQADDQARQTRTDLR